MKIVTQEPLKPFTVLKVLSLEDSKADFEIIREHLIDLAETLEMTRTDRESDYISKLTSNQYDIILGDFKLPQFDAYAALKISNEICPDVPFICISGAIGEITAIELLKNGAVDYVMKDKLERLSSVVKRALMEANEKVARKQAQRELVHNLSMTDATLEAIHNGILVVDFDGRVVKTNRRFSEMWKIPEDILSSGTDDKLVNYALQKLTHPEEFLEKVKMLYSNREAESKDLIHLKDGSVFERISKPMYIGSEPVARVWSFLDITQRYLAEKRMSLTTKILQLINNTGSLNETVEQTLKILNNETGVDAVGIRLKIGEEFPYFSQMGFSKSFLRSESQLLAKEPDGSFCRDKNGKPRYECICGSVLMGNIDYSNSMYSLGGSFWTNDSKELLTIDPAGKNILNQRNHCILSGYLSIAVIPVRAGGEIMGLLQLNDKGKNAFTPEMIAFLENIGNIIGVAFMRKQAQEELEKSHELLYKLAEQVPGALFQYKLSPDGQSYFPYVSPGMKEMLEILPEDVVKDASSVFVRIHPDDRNEVSNLITISARNLSHFHCEFRVELPEQGIRWRFIDALPEKQDDDSILWHGIIYDITAHKESEEELNKKMNELQRFHDLTVNREIHMIELKKEINALLKEHGLPEKYKIVAGL